jgi:hypothetical protein
MHPGQGQPYLHTAAIIQVERGLMLYCQRPAAARPASRGGSAPSVAAAATKYCVRRNDGNGNPSTTATLSQMRADVGQLTGPLGVPRLLMG